MILSKSVTPPPRDNTYFGLIAVFVLSVAAALLYNWVTYQSLYVETPDGTLYLSIADNFIQNGHFIQTARPYEVNFIVPPGLPFLLTAIKGLTGSLYAVIAFQYILFGLTAVFLTASGSHLLPHRPVNVLIPLLFLLYTQTLDSPNPSMLLTELYTAFFLSLTLFVFTHPRIHQRKKALVGMSLLFAAYLIRPVTAGLLAVTAGYYLFQTLRKKWAWKPLALQFLVFALILGANALINHRETGYWVTLENYGGTPLYQANNPSTKTEAYNSNMVKEFSDDYFMDVYFDETLDTQQKNELLSQRASQFIRENLGFCLQNMAIKYENLYLKNWNWNFWAMLAAVAVLVWRRRLTVGQAGFLLGAFTIATVVPAFGLYIPRYSLPAIPFFVLLNGTLYYGAATSFIDRLRRYCLPPSSDGADQGGAAA